MNKSNTKTGGRCLLSNSGFIGSILHVSTVLYIAVYCSTSLYSTVHVSTVLYRTVHCTVALYITVQVSIVHSKECHIKNNNTNFTMSFTITPTKINR